MGHLMEIGKLMFVFAVFGWQGLLLAVIAAVFAIRGIESLSYVANYCLACPTHVKFPLTVPV